MIITELNATGYYGKFTYDGVNGTFNANGQKKLTQVNGTKEDLGSFDADCYDENNWNYNPHFQDPTKAQLLITLMIDSINEIQSELNLES